MTSQRIVDVVLRAFNACAASQGCTKFAVLYIMYILHLTDRAPSNLTFGAGGKDKEGNVSEGWGYYEVDFLPSRVSVLLIRRSLSQTIAGGSGAGPTWHGTSGVHTHITNTRIGDVEILERRYPVLLHRFGLRDGSGGGGKFHGGDGVIREIEFLHQLQVSILSEVYLHCRPRRACTDANLREDLAHPMAWKAENRLLWGATPGSSS